MQVKERTPMKSAIRLATVLAGVLAGLVLMAPPAGAGPIMPVSSAVENFAPLLGSPVTISIYQGGADITNTWRPTWNPTADAAARTVHVVVNINGVPTVPASISLVEPAVPVTAALFTGTVNPFINPATNTLTTSAYPGNCTNYGPRTDLSLDFTFSNVGVPLTTPNGPATGFPLTSQDCGGFAVLSVTVNGSPFTFVMPQDSNANGIPDGWENVFCPGNTCPTGREDSDGGPVTPAQSGDGIAALDEYRGFIVSGAHVSTDPRQKNLFVHLVNPQCGAVPPAPADSLLGGGAKAYPTTQGASLFDGVNSLISGTQVHLLSYAPFAANIGPSPEWVDNFMSYSDATGIVYSASGPQMDRQINANAIYPILDATTGLTVQKGLRVIECVDDLVTSPLGAAGVGSPNGPDNAVIYTKRIVNYINNMINAGGTRPVKHFTYQYVNGVLTPVLLFTGGGAPTDADRDRIASAAIAYYVAMEVAHSTRLTPTLEGTSRTSYGYHHAPGSGSNVDQAIVNKVDKNGGFNSFFIPSVYTSGDQGTFKLRN